MNTVVISARVKTLAPSSRPNTPEDCYGSGHRNVLQGSFPLRSLCLLSYGKCRLRAPGLFLSSRTSVRFRATRRNLSFHDRLYLWTPQRSTLVSPSGLSAPVGDACRPTYRHGPHARRRTWCSNSHRRAVSFPAGGRHRGSRTLLSSILTELREQLLKLQLKHAIEPVHGRPPGVYG